MLLLSGQTLHRRIDRRVDNETLDQSLLMTAVEVVNPLEPVEVADLGNDVVVCGMIADRILNHHDRDRDRHHDLYHRPNKNHSC